MLLCLSNSELLLKVGPEINNELGGKNPVPLAGWKCSLQKRPDFKRRGNSSTLELHVG